MRQPLALWVCARCGRRLFPARLLCPSCGVAEWRRERATRGLVEQLTRVYRAPGRRFDPPVRLVSVRVEGGPTVVARLEDGLDAGEWAALETDGGVTVARRERE